MEHEDTEIIYCSSDSDVEIIDAIEIINNEFEEKDKLGSDINIDTEENLTLPVNTMLSPEKLSTKNDYDDDEDDDVDVVNIDDDDDDEDEDVDDNNDEDDEDEPWVVEEDSSDDSDIDFSLLSNIVCDQKDENNSTTERKMLIGNRKLNNSNTDVFQTFSGDETTENIKIETKQYLPPEKKMKPHQASNEEVDINSELNTNNYEKDEKSLNVEQCINLPSSSVTNLIEETDFSSPSCSKDIPGPSDLSNSTGSPSIFNVNSTEFNEIMRKEQESKLLFNFYNKSFLSGECFTSLHHEFDENTEINQKVVKPLEECDLIKNILKSTTLENSNEDSQTIDSEGFVEEPNIINPDIMYNIDLNEHFSQMDLLVQKIEKTPNDPGLLDECLKLLPIPQIEHEPKTYTIEERTNFLNGISEWEYDIDREDWNKIMVKCAVVFTAHAGFSIANEESLYVLAEVAIDHIKKLAVIMKNNFDIQSKSSYPDKIDPINNSLQEIGVEGGVKELISHFETDVFNRQNRLIKKCQHFQKIIDQYVENILVDSPVKNQYIAKQNTKEDNLSSQKLKKKDESTVKEETVEIDNTMEVATDIQQTLEFNIDNLLLSEVNDITNIEMEPTGNVFFENSNIQVKKIDTEKKNIENKAITPKDTKILKLDLLKPIVTEPIDYNPESILYKTRESTIDLEYQKNQNLFSKKSIFNIEGFGKPNIIEPPTENELNRIKNKKNTELITLQNLMGDLSNTESELLSIRTQEHKKALDDFDEDFNNFKASQNKTDSPNYIDLDDASSMVYDNLTLTQTENIVNYGASSSKEDTSLLNANDNDGSKSQYDSFIDGLLNKL